MINYITRSSVGITINGSEFHKQGLRQFINTLCLQHGSSLEGRIASARYLLNRRLLVPIYVHQDLCFIASSSIRNPDVVYLNVHQIALIESVQYKTHVLFFDGSSCQVNVDAKVIHNQREIANKLLTIFSK